MTDFFNYAGRMSEKVKTIVLKVQESIKSSLIASDILTLIFCWLRDEGFSFRKFLTSLFLLGSAQKCFRRLFQLKEPVTKIITF